MCSQECYQYEALELRFWVWGFQGLKFGSSEKSVCVWESYQSPTQIASISWAMSGKVPSSTFGGFGGSPWKPRQSKTQSGCFFPYSKSQQLKRDSERPGWAFPFSVSYGLVTPVTNSCIGWLEGWVVAVVWRKAAVLRWKFSRKFVLSPLCCNCAVLLLCDTSGDLKMSHMDTWHQHFQSSLF